MERMKRLFTKQDKDTIFKLWKDGKGFSDIAKEFTSKPGTIFTVLRETGGIKPVDSKRAAQHLTMAEREEIRVGLSAKKSIREIARSLNRSPSTISREIKRNGGRRYYKAVNADHRAIRMAKRPRPCVLEVNLELQKLVSDKLELKWSPAQIAGWLKKHMASKKHMQISAETIYKTIYFRKRMALNHLLSKHLRRGHSLRQSKYHSRKGDRGTIKVVNGKSIHKRPKSVETRKTIGHWEGDLVSGSKNSHIATLVERKSRYTILLKLKGKDAESVKHALIEKFQSLPKSLRKSLTWDRGMELAQHAEISAITSMPIYFCDPKSPWQRGTNENTNSLVRQYFPKKTCLSVHSQQTLDAVANELNERPRKTLKFKSPKQVLGRSVALTG